MPIAKDTEEDNTYCNDCWRHAITFEEFIGKFDPTTEPVGNKQVGLTKNQLQEQVDKANRILSGFVPPDERG